MRAGRCCAGLLPVVMLAAGWVTPVRAATLEVGPARALRLPSQAARLAADGDRIVIDPGRYEDCAVWTADRVAIVAAGPGVVIQGKVCQDKAIFVISGNGVSVSGIGFAHARSSSANGAGIRAEGRGLTVRNSRFVDNENGILAGALPGSTITVENSEFLGNGSCAQDCAHGIYAGRIALLRITGCRFFETRAGHHVKSRALRTELAGNTIADGPAGTSSYLVDVPNGGSLLMRDNVLDKGEGSENPGAAVIIGAEGNLNPPGEIIVADNHFTSRLPGGTVFVDNRTATHAVLSGNVLNSDAPAGRVTALRGPGSVR